MTEPESAGLDRDRRTQEARAEQGLEARPGERRGSIVLVGPRAQCLVAQPGDLAQRVANGGGGIGEQDLERGHTVAPSAR
ncbi:MAG TPA: hypothetical protein VF516_19585 [Kofleriaceae bacterium]